MSNISYCVTNLLKNSSVDLSFLWSSRKLNAVKCYFFFLLFFFRACEELVKTLGFDWIMMFMEEHLHSTTVTAAMRILVVLLSNQSILIKFKEGLSGGGWLDQTDSVLTNKIGTVLGMASQAGRDWRAAWEWVCIRVRVAAIVWILSGRCILSVVCLVIRCLCALFFLQLRVRFPRQKGVVLQTCPSVVITQISCSSVLPLHLDEAGVANHFLILPSWWD